MYSVRPSGVSARISSLMANHFSAPPSSVSPPIGEGPGAAFSADETLGADEILGSGGAGTAAQEEEAHVTLQAVVGSKRTVEGALVSRAHAVRRPGFLLPADFVGVHFYSTNPSQRTGSLKFAAGFCLAPHSRGVDVISACLERVTALTRVGSVPDEFHHYPTKLQALAIITSILAVFCEDTFRIPPVSIHFTKGTRINFSLTFIEARFNEFRISFPQLAHLLPSRNCTKRALIEGIKNLIRHDGIQERIRAVVLSDGTALTARLAEVLENPELSSDRGVTAVSRFSTAAITSESLLVPPPGPSGVAVPLPNPSRVAVSDGQAAAAEANPPAAMHNIISFLEGVSAEMAALIARVIRVEARIAALEASPPAPYRDDLLLVASTAAAAPLEAELQAEADVVAGAAVDASASQHQPASMFDTLTFMTRRMTALTDQVTGVTTRMDRFLDGASPLPSSMA